MCIKCIKKLKNSLNILVSCLVAVSLTLIFLPNLSYANNQINTNSRADDKYKSEKVSTDICDEGIVLLKNENVTNQQTGKSKPALPLSDNKINIFGAGGCDNGWYYQGNGSGAGSTANRVPLYQAFRDNNFRINEKLASAYNNSGVNNHVPVTEDPAINYVINQASTSFVNNQITQAKEFSNQAVYVLSRYGGEGNDLPKFQCKKIDNAQTNVWDGDRIYSQLTSEEEEQIKLICQNFDNVCILFNCCCPMEMGFLNDYSQIKSALYMPMGGNWGTYCVPRVMNGSVNPSGHLTDTAAYDLKTAPSYANMSYSYVGEDSFSKRYEDKRFAGHENEYVHYTTYEENIYTGYYWYETADTDGYWASKGKNYNEVVQFPFGFGKSFTNFEWSNFKILSNGSELKNISGHEDIDISVDVKNIGNVAGKDVVQLYIDKPYKKGGVEKPSTQLISFAKTDILEPGKSTTVKMHLSTQDFADYDCYDKNNNGHMGYELDDGSYKFVLKTDSHNEKSNLSKTLNLASTVNYEKDKDTNTPITNLFTTFENKTSGASSKNSDKHSEGAICGSIDGSDLNNGQGIGAKYLTRADFAGTFPTKFMSKPDIGDDYNKTYPVKTPWIESDHELKPQDQTVTKTLEDLSGKSYDDPAWDEVMNSLSYDEMFSLVQAKGGFGSPAIEKIKKPQTIDKDGPCGFSGGVNGSKIAAANYPSDSMIGSTWNYKLSSAFGTCIGYEAINRLGGIDGNYGPGLDLHRSPLGGRNFEYYSEDPVLSGVLCSWQISSSLDQGMYSFVKHIALNDSDTGRNGRFNFATEQTFRQIYAKPFEIISKGAKCYDQNTLKQAHQANAMMASVDRIGTTRVTGSYNFLTQMVRNEWGFRGMIVTDYYQSGNVNDVDEGIRVGNDLMLNGANNCEYDDTTSNTAKYYIRQACKNNLYTYVQTKYFKKIAKH